MTDHQNNEDSQYDLYLQEIEGIDDYWGPTFRWADTCVIFHLIPVLEPFTTMTSTWNLETS